MMLELGQLCYLSIFIVVAIILFVFIFLVYVSLYTVPNEFLFDERPPSVLMYSKGFLRCLTYSQGKMYSNKAGSDHGLQFTARRCKIQKEKLKQYNNVCGNTNEDEHLSACFLEIYFMPLMICIATSAKFCLSPLGLIHIRQSVSQHCDIKHLLDEPFDAKCSVAKYHSTDRGIEADLMLQIYNQSGICVWEGVTTVLSRSKRAQRSGRSSTRELAKSEQSNQDNGSKILERVKVANPGDLGIQYAKASGDWNPHHLWPWSARLLGYSKPIVQGMWTMARCLVQLEKNSEVNLGAKFHMEVQFKRPVFLPSVSVYTFFRQSEDNHITFQVKDEKTEAPQLLGSITLKE